MVRCQSIKAEHLLTPSGIGLAVAEAMAEAGAHVALWYNSNSAAIERAAELTKTHGIVS